MKFFLFTIFLCFSVSAATLNSDGTASDTQTQITAASTGDTVLLPSAGSFTWSADVTIPSTKGITLDLNGSTVTMSGAGNEFIINSTASGATVNRVTNGSLVRGSGFDQFSAPITLADSRTGSGLRIDHLTFSGSNVILDINGRGAGVMDHCIVIMNGAAQEGVHINGWGPSDTTGWTTDSGATLAGSGAIFHIENNRFQCSSTVNPSWLQAYYGARFSFRFNTNDNVSVDVHGTPGAIGGRWWEIYGNQFTNVSAGNQGAAINIRAGSGIIASNTWTGTESISIELGEEDTGSYPLDYQPGRGLNNTSDPAYVWANWDDPPSLDSCECQGGGTAGLVVEDRDVFFSARPSWSPNEYPHPLRGESGEEEGVSGTITVGGATISGGGTISFQ